MSMQPQEPAVVGTVINLRQTSNGGIARAKMEEYVERGRANGMRVLQRLEQEIPRDIPVHPKKVEFRVEDSSLQIRDEATEGWVHMHSNATRQAAGRVNFSVKYLQRLLQEDAKGFGKELIALNLSQLYANLDFGVDPFLRARLVGANDKRQVRAFMSMNYKPLDSRPLFQKFLEVTNKAGAVIVDGFSSDTRVALSAIVPQVQQVSPTEYVVYGIRLRNSDFGQGPVALEPFLTRLLCLNGMTTESAYKQIHLGGRSSWEISRETYAKDLDATLSMISDIVSHRLGDGFINSMTAQFKASSETEISKEKAELLIRTVLNAEERKRVLALFEQESRDPYTMPEGKTTWSLANAVSFLANQGGIDDDRRAELHDAAGQILCLGKSQIKAAKPIGLPAVSELD